MSFDYNYASNQLEEYIVNNCLDGQDRETLFNLLLSLLNGEDHLEHMRDWMNEYTQKEEVNE